MRTIAVFLLMLSVASAMAQVSAQEMAALLGMNDLWSQDAILSLPQQERRNKVVDMGTGMALSGSLDVRGYMACVNRFREAADRAGELFGDSVTIAFSVWASSDVKAMEDSVAMDGALRSGNAFVNVAWKYEVNARQKVILSLMCNKNERSFVMALSKKER